MTLRRPFAGTANDYLRYRPAYPEAFLAQLRTHVNGTDSRTMLDLGCGPGRVAIPLARHFDRVLAIDVEPEMIDAGRREADRRGAANIEWRVARAEDVQMPARSIALITIGEAFHRLDQRRVIENAQQWLEPRGVLATLGGEPLWRGHAAWQHVLTHIVNKWTGNALRDPHATMWSGPRDLLSAAGFDVAEHEVTVPLVWTCEAIVGFMFSTSIASRTALASDAERFAAELRAALIDLEPSGRFVAAQRFAFTAAKYQGH